MAECADEPIRDVLTAERADFVSTRDRRAAELGRGGDDEKAERVRALRKPSVALWSLLVLARERPATLDALADAIAGVRAALGGRGEPRAAQDELQTRLREVIAEARSLARDHGERVSNATAERIAGIVRASVSSADVLDLLRRGVLTEEPETDGFASLEGMPSAPRRASSTVSTTKQAQAAEERRRKRETKAVERRLTAARRDAEAARRRADAAVADAERAEAEVQEIEAELASLRQAV
jgi:hypothetical protein